jgi:HSP20 family protein
MAKREPWFPLPLPQLSQEVDRLFDELIHRRWKGSRSTTEEWSPQLDLYETDTEFVLEVDLPGVKKQEVSVEVEENYLVLQGRRAAERRRTEGNFHYHERRSGQFLRRLLLPTSVNREQIRAEFRNGVLRVSFPKMQKGGQASS